MPLFGDDADEDSSRREEQEEAERFLFANQSDRRKLLLPSTCALAQFDLSVDDEDRFKRFSFLIKTSLTKKIGHFSRSEAMVVRLLTSDASQFDDVLLQLLTAVLFFAQFVSQIS